MSRLAGIAFLYIATLLSISYEFVFFDCIFSEMDKVASYTGKIYIRLRMREQSAAGFLFSLQRPVEEASYRSTMVQLLIKFYSDHKVRVWTVRGNMGMILPSHWSIPHFGS